MKPILSVRELSKLYRNQRGIRDIHLEIFPGDIYGLLGPNGAGKTTILKLVTGLIRADQGFVELFGSAISEQYAQGMRRVGCMIEAADFHDFISASQYLRLVKNFYPELPEKRIDEVLDMVGLLGVRKDKIKHFSTGMKQKLALAAAILPEPEFVILDEPTNGLDVEGTVMFRNLVRRCSEENGTTFLISSHMIHELEQLCNRVGVIFEGTLRAEGRVTELMSSWDSLEQYYIDELQKAREAVQHA